MTISAGELGGEMMFDTELIRRYLREIAAVKSNRGIDDGHNREVVAEIESRVREAAARRLNKAILLLELCDMDAEAGMLRARVKG